MKKILLGAVILATCLVHADDSYIYWMMDDTTSGYDYKNVQISAVDTSSWKSTPLELAIVEDSGYVSIGTSVSKEDANALKDAGFGFYVNLGEYATDAYSYFFELVNDSGQVVAHSNNGLSWAAAKTRLASAMGVAGTSGDPWTPSEGGGGGFSPGAVPEPTSGLMLLLGVAALSLRRRRV